MTGISERPAPGEPLALAQRQRACRFDRAHQKPQVKTHECVKLLMPNREEDAPSESRQPLHRFGQVVDLDPMVARLGRPRGPEQAQARHLRSVLTGAGFFEAVTFGFIGETAAAGFAAAGDVAAELAMQPGAVRVSKSRVLWRLRRDLGDVPAGGAE